MASPQKKNPLEIVLILSYLICACGAEAYSAFQLLGHGIPKQQIERRGKSLNCTHGSINYCCSCDIALVIYVNL